MAELNEEHTVTRAYKQNRPLRVKLSQIFQTHVLVKSLARKYQSGLTVLPLLVIRLNGWCSCDGGVGVWRAQMMAKEVAYWYFMVSCNVLLRTFVEQQRVRYQGYLWLPQSSSFSESRVSQQQAHQE